jgi:hypothetical protein
MDACLDQENSGARNGNALFIPGKTLIPSLVFGCSPCGSYASDSTPVATSDEVLSVMPSVKRSYPVDIDSDVARFARLQCIGASSSPEESCLSGRYTEQMYDINGYVVVDNWKSSHASPPTARQRLSRVMSLRISSSSSSFSESHSKNSTTETSLTKQACERVHSILYADTETEHIMPRRPHSTHLGNSPPVLAEDALTSERKKNIFLRMFGRVSPRGRGSKK